jgi:hypothetical protein
MSAGRRSRSAANEGVKVAVSTAALRTRPGWPEKLLKI